MTVEIMMLVLMVGMTFLAYMIAINAHGLVRLILSYMLATVILAGTVWSIVQQVNFGYDTIKIEELKKLEAEKKLAEERAQIQEDSLKNNKQRMGFSGKLNTVITSGAALAASIINLDLQDKSFDLNGLIKRSTNTKRAIEVLRQDFEKLTSSDPIFNEPMALLKEAIQQNIEAGYYLGQFYYSEDSDQEELRERVMRQKARSAYEKFQKASSLLASIN